LLKIDFSGVNYISAKLTNNFRLSDKKIEFLILLKINNGIKTNECLRFRYIKIFIKRDLIKYGFLN